MKTLTMLILLLVASIAPAQLKIVTTATDYADLARQIGGDKVTVQSIMRGPENVHNVLAGPTEMVKLNKADLFVHSGLDTEPWRDNLVRGARNAKIVEGNPSWVDLSVGITLRDVATGATDRSKGDMHAYGDPHFTMNLPNGMRMVATLTRAMAEVDPSNADFYRENARKLVTEFAEMNKELRAKLDPLGGLKIVTFHRAWGYFADSMGLSIVDTIEPHVGITPSPGEVVSLIERMRAQGVKIVVCETYNDRKLAQSIADKVGAVMIVLPDHVLGVPEVKSYQQLFRYNVDKLIDAAKAAGIEPRSP